MVEAVGFSHESAEAVALNGFLEQRLRRPDEDLRLAVGRLPSHTQRPRRKAFAMLVKKRYALLTAESTIF